MTYRYCTVLVNSRRGKFARSQLVFPSTRTRALFYHKGERGGHNMPGDRSMPYYLALSFLRTAPLSAVASN